jgi:hypothetical protein
MLTNHGGGDDVHYLYPRALSAARLFADGGRRASRKGRVERGTETYQATVRDVTGAVRDRLYAEQARRYPGFAEDARGLAGVRTIPVLARRRPYDHP